MCINMYLYTLNKTAEDTRFGGYGGSEKKAIKEDGEARELIAASQGLRHPLYR
jgi:hypothetical protein